MIDFAEQIVIPRPRTRALDKILSALNRVSPWFAALALGFCIGLAQGAMQSDNHWVDKIITRSTVDSSGKALAVHEDENGVYYSHMERRNP